MPTLPTLLAPPHLEVPAQCPLSVPFAKETLEGLQWQVPPWGSRCPLAECQGLLGCQRGLAA